MKKFTLLSACCLLIVCFSTSAYSKALIIQDNPPWNGDGQSSTTLTLLGYSYDQITSTQFDALSSLAGYDYIVYASDQVASYYTNVAANIGLINNFVFNGGTLLAHLTMWGWNYGSAPSPYDLSSLLPGGAGVASVNQYSDSVKILDPSAKVVNGDFGLVSEASLQGWNWSTHGYFTGVGSLDNLDVVIGIGDASEPTYMQYTYGAGTVRANLMTMEWGANDNPPGSRQIFRDNEYAQAQHDSVPEPGTMLLFGTGLAGLVGLRRARKQS